MQTKLFKMQTRADISNKTCGFICGITTVCQIISQPSYHITTVCQITTVISYHNQIGIKLKIFWQITLLLCLQLDKFPETTWNRQNHIRRKLKPSERASRRPELRLDDADRITLFRTLFPLSVCPASVWFQFSSYGILGGEVFFQYFLPKESSFTKGFNVEKIPLCQHRIVVCTTCKVLHLWQKGPELKYIFIPLIIKQNVHFSSLRLKYIVGVLTMHCLSRHGNDISWVSTENRSWLIPQTAVARLLWLR